MAPIFTKRLQKEFKDLKTNPPPGVKLQETDSLSLWLIDITPPADCLYSNTFTIKVSFSKDYPLDSPEVIFLSPVPIHPHIYQNGHICLSILYDHWTPALTVSSVCLSLQSMLASCTEKVLPKDNDSYLASGVKSPKDSGWIFHDDDI
ncbi:ubiquitin-conjugating enzyme/RWD-like protein [Globomyces pollinis-pini]|nr:ubiquitin-conjugating enzyme/RWD-like protein [Globomyces pollinis-pini]KAJ2995610.1 ubiquitin-conjugating enzyme E2 W [Globomyces sp. JEL0801]